MTNLLPYLESAAGVSLALFSARTAASNPSNTPLLNRLTNSAVATFGFWLFLSSVPAMLPVIMEADLEVKSASAGDLVVSLTVTKVQECEWVSTEAFVSSSDGVISKASLTFSDIGQSTRPVGRNNYGLWRIQFSPYTRVDSIQFRSYHECGHKWQVVSEQGPFTLLSIPTLPKVFSLDPYRENQPSNPIPLPTPTGFPIPNYSLVTRFDMGLLDSNRNRVS